MPASVTHPTCVPGFIPSKGSVYTDKMSRLLRVAVLLAFAVTYGRLESCTSVTTGEKANICRCDGSDFYIDISKYLTYPQKQLPDPEQPGKYVYAYSPCVPIDCSTTGANDADSHLCQNKKEGGAQVASLGRNVASNWTINSKSPLIFTITYTGGDPDGKISRLSVVKFTHGTGTPSMAFIEEEEETFSIKYIFELKGNLVTTLSIGGGGGGRVAAGIPGIVIMILLLVAVVTYFIVGALTNYFHLGARGVEVIPQYTFWKDVPFLIKDGFLFMLSPCYHPDKGSYQSL